jgi:hypothetical protein
MLLAMPSTGVAAAVAVCGAAAPAIGSVVHGPVLQVIDARTVCVALGALPDQWLALRLSRPIDGEAGRPARLVFSRTVTCRVTGAGAAGAWGVCRRVEPVALTPADAVLP